MELKGGQQIAAAVEQVWAGLFDPEILQRCLPGCESVTRESEYAYTSKLALKIGPVSARFSGRVEMQDVQAPQRCKLVFQGTGGTAGFARGEAQVSLTARDGGTYLEYDAAVNVGGKLAQIGARLVDSTAKKLAGEFFERFQAVFEPPAEETVAEPVAAAAAAAPTLDASTAAPSGAAAQPQAAAGRADAPGAGTAAAGAAVPAPRRPAAVAPTTGPLAQLWRSPALWFVVGAGVSGAISQQWVDERAGWFILGAALAYLLTRLGSGRDA